MIHSIVSLQPFHSAMSPKQGREEKEKETNIHISQNRSRFNESQHSSAKLFIQPPQCGPFQKRRYHPRTFGYPCA